MKCTLCGSELESGETTLPFKVSDTSIVIVKDVPVLQCENCTEYILEDGVYARIEQLLGSVDQAAELEVVRYAA